MYTADNFIKRAQEFLNVQVEHTTIEEVKELRQQDEAVQKEAQKRSLERIDSRFGNPATLSAIIRQSQETASIINSLGGVSALIKEAEGARQALQLYNNLGLSSLGSLPLSTLGSTKRFPISDETDSDTSGSIDNEADQDSNSDEH